MSDITYIRVGGRWHYVCVVIDLFARKLIAWKASKRPDTTLTTDTLQIAYTSRNMPKNVLFHSDRGTQYTSQNFRKLIDNLDFIHRNVHDVMNVLCSSTNESLAEMQFGMIQEIINGEYSPEVTRLSKRNMRRLLLIYHLHRQIGNSKSTSNAKQEGILYKLFNFDIQSNDCE